MFIKFEGGYNLMESGKRNLITLSNVVVNSTIFKVTILTNQKNENKANFENKSMSSYLNDKLDIIQNVP